VPGCPGGRPWGTVRLAAGEPAWAAERVSLPVPCRERLEPPGSWLRSEGQRRLSRRLLSGAAPYRRVQGWWDEPRARLPGESAADVPRRMPASHRDADDARAGDDEPRAAGVLAEVVGAATVPRARVAAWLKANSVRSGSATGRARLPEARVWPEPGKPAPGADHLAPPDVAGYVNRDDLGARHGQRVRLEAHVRRAPGPRDAACRAGEPGGAEGTSAGPCLGAARDGRAERDEPRRPELEPRWPVAAWPRAPRAPRPFRRRRAASPLPRSQPRPGFPKRGQGPLSRRSVAELEAGSLAPPGSLQPFEALR
jgi:hypothetical protein